jgi:hypothetical protein
LGRFLEAGAVCSPEASGPGVKGGDWIALTFKLECAGGASARVSGRAL